MLFLVWVGALGCGDGDAPAHPVEEDAGPEDAGTFVPPVPAPPVAPADAAAPMLTPCPAGWREVIDADDPDVVTCDPWPEGGPLACGPDEAHFPGGGGCSRIGSACAGEWPADLPADAIYVRAGEPGGGDGTAGAPLGRIADAMAVAADGQTVALSTGDFAEEVTVDRAVTLRGACVAGTRIVAPVGGTGVALTASGAAIEDLSVEGGSVGISAYPADGAVRIARVVGSGATWFELEGTGPFALDVEDTVLRDAIGFLGVGTAARFSNGVDATLRRVSLLGAASRGLVVQGEGTRATLEDCALVANGSGEGFLALGEGIEVASGEATLTRSAVQGSAATDVDVNFGGSIVFDDVVVGDVAGVVWSAEYGTGMNLHGGVRAELHRVVVRGSRDTGVVVAEAGTSLEAEDLVVADGAGTVSAFGGLGMQAFADSSVRLVRAAFLRNRLVGLLVDLRAGMVAEDLRVRGTREQIVDRAGGYGVQLSLGATGEVTRMDLSGNRTVGLLCGPDTTLTLSDARITDTVPAVGSDWYGYGAVFEGEATIERIAALRNRAAAVVVSGAAVALTDLDVEGTSSREDGGVMGYGLAIVEGAEVSLARARIAANRGAGVLVIESALAAEDLDVEGTLPQACAETGCPGGGNAVVAREAATISIERFRVTESALCGLQIAVGGAIDLSGGEVSANLIGANVQDRAFDPSRLLGDVLWKDNDQNLDATSLPLPDPPDGI